MDQPLVIPKGFSAAALAAGIKASGDLDIAVFVAERRASAAGVFTQNRMAAAPVQWSRGLVPSDRARAIVVNAGNANAATGQAGLDHARGMAATAARALGCEPEQVLVASTGVIGRPLPFERVAPAIETAVARASSNAEAFETASRAIMTTDTRPKVAARSLSHAKDEFHVLGLAKGAAMIGPNMATMLAFILTDVRIGPGLLQGMLARAVDDSFNSISVEGHTSTNDTVLALACDAGGPPLSDDAQRAFAQALREVCADLARMIVDDAEGCSHTITIDVQGCLDDDEAKRIAQTIANDALVKTAITGADPNWGRIVSAAGRAGVPFEPEDLGLWLNGVPLFQGGTPTAFDAAALSDSIRSNRDVAIRLVFLNPRGEGRARFLTSDLTAEYVRLNSDYTT